MKTKFLPLFLILFMGGFQVVMGQNFNFQSLDRPWAVEAGIGVGWTYADNSSAFRRASFSLHPAASVSLARNISPVISLRGTFGFQQMEGNFNADLDRKIRMGEQGNAYHFGGEIFYFDFMPVFNFVGGPRHVNRSQVNIYGGVGVGVLGIMGDYDIMVNGESQNINNDMVIATFPARAGISYRFRPQLDFALEGTVLITLRDDIDGHTGYNRFDDYPMNVQFKVRKMFSFDY
ncbi:hypothetical protein [Litoribacter populi]|uniref:hypothetical protein n=1 Tax=Litoribacter populi TaxID=2598460 RepID=UPI00118133DC|nr:hypothetical protein [Litoribacter populi]